MAPNSVLTAGSAGIVPILFNPGGASVQFTFTIGSIISAGGLNFSGDRFFGLNDNFSGGLLTINASTLTFGPGGIAFANFNGADGLSTPDNAGGAGGTFIVNAAGNIVVNAAITATTGLNNNVSSGGAGGAVELHSANGAVSVTDRIEVSSHDLAAGRVSASGGNITITSNAASGTAINIGSTAQLLSLLDLGAPGSGGHILLRATGNASSIDINNGDGAIIADRGLIDIRQLGVSGAINLTSPNLFAEAIKIGALGSNGTLTISGGAISADMLLRLYAGGSNGSIIFSGSVTLSSQTSATLIAANSVTILNGVLVTIGGQTPAFVYTNLANYTGSGGNGATTGMFGGAGATTQPFASAPPFDGTPGAQAVTYTGAPNGVWNNAAVWNPTIVPNNGNGGFVFDVIFGSGLITQNIAAGVTVEQLFMTGGTIILANPLTLHSGLQFAGGTLRDGTINLDGPSQQSALMTVNSTTLNNSGNYALTLASGDAFSGANSVFNNSGTLTTSGAGAVSFNIALNNTGTVMVQNGTLRLTSGGSLSGALVVGSGAVLELASNYTIASGTSLSGAGVLRLANNTTSTVAGAFLNNGNVFLNSTGNFTDLVLSGDLTLNGSGVITLVDAARIRGSGVLTNAGNTITGAANNSGSGLGANEIGIVNQAAGIIDANVNGAAFNIDPGTVGLTNQGLMRASNGGLLLLNGNGGSGFDNTGGTISALAGSQVQLINGATISGGILNTSGTGFFSTLNSATLSGLTNAGDFRVSNNTSLSLVGTINNTGSISLNSTGNFTDLVVSGNVTLTGNGIINFADAARLLGTGILTNANNILQGQANNSGSGVGANQLTVINQAGGLVDANISGGVLNVDPGGSGFSNQGRLRASAGGILLLNGNGGEGFNNTGGVIEALNGAQVSLANGVFVTGGTLATSGSGTIRNISSATLDSLLLTGNFIGNNNTSTTFSGTITSTGSILLDSTGNFTDLLINGNVTLTGGSALTLQNAARVRGAGTLFIGGSAGEAFTIQGEANNSGSGLGANELTVVVRSGGLVDANVQAGVLNVDPGSGGLTNQGLMRASNGGLLLLNGNGGGGFDNSSGIISALNGSEVQLSNGVTISGGVLQTSGTGFFRTLNSAILSGLTNAGDFRVTNNTSLTLVGTINNTGSISVNSTGNFTDLLINGNVTLTGNGTVNLNDAARIRGAGVLTNANNVIQGSANNSGSGLGVNEIGIINQAAGVIDASVSGGAAFNIDPGTAGLINQGIMRASNGGVLVLNGNGGGAFTNAGAVISALNGSEVQLTNGASISGGTLSTVGTGFFRTLNHAVLSGLTNAGDFRVGNNTSLTLMGTINNTGSISINSTGNFTDLVINGNVTLTGNGAINLTDAARILGTGTLTNAGNIIQGAADNSGSGLGFNQIGIVNQAAGIIDANSNGLVLNVDPNATDGLNNQGLMRASNGGILQLNGNGGGAFTNSGTIAAVTGGVLRFNGTVTSSGTVDVGNGTLTGTGTYTQTGGSFILTGGTAQLNSALNFQGGLVDARGTINAAIMNNAMLRPALGGSGLAVTGNVTLLGSSQLIFQLGGLAQGSQYGFLNVNGTCLVRREFSRLVCEWFPSWEWRQFYRS